MYPQRTVGQLTVSSFSLLSLPVYWSVPGSPLQFLVLSWWLLNYLGISNPKVLCKMKWQGPFLGHCCPLIDQSELNRRHCSCVGSLVSPIIYCTLMHEGEIRCHPPNFLWIFARPYIGDGNPYKVFLNFKCTLHLNRTLASEFFPKGYKGAPLGCGDTWVVCIRLKPKLAWKPTATARCQTHTTDGILYL